MLHLKVSGLKTFKNNGEGKDYFISLDKEVNTKNVIRARSHKLIQKFLLIKEINMYGVLLAETVDFNFKNPKV